MTRLQLEHLLRAAGSITSSDSIVVVGSQAILGSFPNAPAELTRSMEADLFPLNHPERADLLDGSIGEKSPFHETFGYYAHGVSPDTAVVPENWQLRLVPIKSENTRSVEGLCLSPEDLVVSKLAAGREKDLEFVAGMLQHNLVQCDKVEKLIDCLQRERREPALQRLRRLSK